MQPRIQGSLSNKIDNRVTERVCVRAPGTEPSNPMADNKFRSDRELDPIAELARLITQANPYGESAPAVHRFRKRTTSEGYDESPGLPPAPQLPPNLNPPEQAYEPDEYRHDDQAYDVADQSCAADEEYQTEVPLGRRRSLALVMAITGLALLGTAGAFGYRDILGSTVPPKTSPTIIATNEPNKITPASSAPQTKNSDDTSQAGTATTGSIGNLASREEQPATIEPPKAAPTPMGAPAAPTPPTAGHTLPNQVMPRVAAAADPPGPPPAAAVASQRAGQSGAPDVTAAANRAHLAAAHIAPAEVNNTASVTPPVSGSGYAVQVTSERSESAAQATFRDLRARYPNQLGGRQPIIRRADRGAAGIYYRGLVGPFASAEKAAKMCSGLKAAGSDCIIQKN
jgi:hypothetical protein